MALPSRVVRAGRSKTLPYIAIAILVCSIVWTTWVRPARSAAPLAPRWDYVGAVAKLRALRPSRALPLAVFVPVLPGAAIGALLSRTLRSLQLVDRISETVLVFVLGDGEGVAAAAAAIDAVVWAPTLIIHAPPPNKRSDGGAAWLTYHALAFAFDAAELPAAVVLPAGIDVSEDVLDHVEWAMREIARDGSLTERAFALNLYYNYGEGFGGSERYTFATEELGLTAWGGWALPARSWPLARAAWPRGSGAGGLAWDAVLARAVTAAGLKVLTPRISRSRFEGTDPSGRASDFEALLDAPARDRARRIYIPDHPITYAGHTLITVPRHR